MKSWICSCGVKNDYDSAACYVCGKASNVKVKEYKGLERRSDKRAEQESLFAKKVAVWKKGKVCVMCDWEGKKNTNITPHHKQGRDGDLLLDFTKIIPLCVKHHGWATEHSNEAIALGISLPRNSRPEEASNQ